MNEYEVRLYEPRARRASIFTRVPLESSALGLARRWRSARPDCRVEITPTAAPRPRALAIAE